jgi:hypothetical protein
MMDSFPVAPFSSGRISVVILAIHPFLSASRVLGSATTPSINGAASGGDLK